MIDEIDAEILEILQESARTSNAEIARRLKMAPSAILERIRKLEERGVIRGYHASIDPKAAGKGLLAFISVRSEERLGAPETAAYLGSLPNVLEVHHVAGEDCFLVKVRAADTESLGQMLRDELGASGTIRATKTTIVLGTVKEASSIPLPKKEEAER